MGAGCWKCPSLGRRAPLPKGAERPELRPPPRGVPPAVLHCLQLSQLGALELVGVLPAVLHCLQLRALAPVGEARRC